MIGEHTAHFRIRHSECDPLKHLYTGSYFRLMHEASVEASFAHGIDLEPDGSVWIPRTSFINMEHPLHMRDQIRVQLAFNSSGYKSIQAGYTFLKEDGTTTTRGAAHWLLQDLHTGEVQPLPETLHDASSNEVSPMPDPPQRSAIPEGAVRHRVRIGWSDFSPENVVYNARYMDHMVNAAMQVGQKYDWSFERCMEAGVIFVAKKQWLTYHRSPSLNEEIEITTWLANVRRSTAQRQYVVERTSDRLLLAEGTTLFVTIDPDQGRPIRIPAQFKEDLADHISRQA